MKAIKLLEQFKEIKISSVFGEQGLKERIILEIDEAIAELESQRAELSSEPEYEYQWYSRNNYDHISVYEDDNKKYFTATEIGTKAKWYTRFEETKRPRQLAPAPKVCNDCAVKGSCSIRAVLTNPQLNNFTVCLTEEVEPFGCIYFKRKELL